MNTQEDNKKFEDMSTTTPSASAVSLTTTLPLSGSTESRNNKKRKLDFIIPQTISENNIAKFSVLKKLNILLTRAEHHINYCGLEKGNIVARIEVSESHIPLEKDENSVMRCPH